MNALTSMPLDSRKFFGPSTLSPGIAIQFLNGDKQKSKQLRINSGTQRANLATFTEVSFVPKQDWKPLSISEAEKVFNFEEVRTDAERISIWRIPDEITRHFEGFRDSITKYNDELLLDNLWTHAEYQRGRNKLFKTLYTAGVGESLKILGHYSRLPGLIASSINGDGKFVGLHMDSWVNASVSQRTSGFPSRFCVNLGPETRLLNVLNLSIRQICSYAQGNVTEEPNDLVVEFLHDNPNYPLIQIAIEPGEAYIAPTEIMIHDATTLGKQFVDASMTLLGNFTVAALENLAAKD